VKNIHNVKNTAIAAFHVYVISVAGHNGSLSSGLVRIYITLHDKRVTCLLL
jgi:hypothetical protein